MEFQKQKMVQKQESNFEKLVPNHAPALYSNHDHAAQYSNLN